MRSPLILTGVTPNGSEVRPDAAGGVICAAANRRGIKMLEVTPAMAEQIRVAALLEDQRAQRSWLNRYLDFCWRVAWTGAKIAIAAVCGVALVVLVWLMYAAIQATWEG